MTSWKYTLDIDDEQTIDIPHHARLLSVQMQRNALCLWAMVCPLNAPTARRFYIFGTGHELPSDILRLEYLGTVQQGLLVWHVFVEPEGVRVPRG